MRRRSRQRTTTRKPQRKKERSERLFVQPDPLPCINHIVALPSLFRLFSFFCLFPRGVLSLAAAAAADKQTSCLIDYRVHHPSSIPPLESRPCHSWLLHSKQAHRKDRRIGTGSYPPPDLHQRRPPVCRPRGPSYDDRATWSPQRLFFSPPFTSVLVWVSFLCYIQYVTYQARWRSKGGGQGPARPIDYLLDELLLTSPSHQDPSPAPPTL